MQDTIKQKLLSLTERFDEVSVLLSSPEVIANQNEFRELSKEYAKLEPIAESYRTYEKCLHDIEDAKMMLAEDDAELKALAEDDIKEAEKNQKALEEALKILLLPKDENDTRNIFLEIRAGTGGDEAAIFAGDLYRMYARFAEKSGWRTEIISANEGEHGGYKEIITQIQGKDVYGQLKFESGAHRVQRVPETESQGRVHTSACTVAVMPEVDEIDDIEISSDELRIDTFRASGAGGQHVNKTDSAIRITHLPTNTVVECQDERSQHKNRARAMSLLKTRLLDEQINKQRQEQASTRKSLVGSGDRSERIRTYNYPQGRVTDHRINLTLYKLPEIMEGSLDEIISSLLTENQAELLAELAESAD